MKKVSNIVAKLDRAVVELNEAASKEEARAEQLEAKASTVWNGYAKEVAKWQTAREIAETVLATIDEGVKAVHARFSAKATKLRNAQGAAVDSAARARRIAERVSKISE